MHSYLHDLTDEATPVRAVQDKLNKIICHQWPTIYYGIRYIGNLGFEQPQRPELRN